MSTARSHAAAEARKAASATKSKAPASAELTGTADATGNHDQTASAKTAPQSASRSLTLTIPLDGDAVYAAAQTAATAVMVPVTAAKNVLRSRKAGVPAYLGIAGLAAMDLIEWPVAAVAGVGLAYLRRWGPLRPESAKPPQVKVTQAKPVEASEASAKAAPGE